MIRHNDFDARDEIDRMANNLLSLQEHFSKNGTETQTVEMESSMNEMDRMGSDGLSERS